MRIRMSMSAIWIIYMYLHVPLLVLLMDKFLHLFYLVDLVM